MCARTDTMNKTTETKRRSLLKTATWRVVATVITMLLVYVFSKDVAISAIVGVLEFISKILAYYTHERIWSRTNTLRRFRYIVKSVTWRIIASTITTMLAIMFGIPLETSLLIGGIELSIKLLIYYLHEKLWLNVRWGQRAV